MRDFRSRAPTNQSSAVHQAKKRSPSANQSTIDDKRPASKVQQSLQLMMDQTSGQTWFGDQSPQSGFPVQREGTGNSSAQTGTTVEFDPVDLDELEKYLNETGESSSSYDNSDANTDPGEESQSQDESSDYAQGKDKNESEEDEIADTTFAHKKIDAFWDFVTELEKAVDSEDHKTFNAISETVATELAGFRQYLAHHTYHFSITKEDLIEKFTIVNTYLTYIIEDGIAKIPDNQKPLDKDKKDKENEKYRDLINFRKSLNDTNWQPSQESWQSSLAGMVDKGKAISDIQKAGKTVYKGKDGIEDKAEEDEEKVKTANGVKGQLKRCSNAYDKLKGLKLQDVNTAELDTAIEECTEALTELESAVSVLSVLPGVAIIFNAIALIKDMIKFYQAAKSRKELKSQSNLSSKEAELSKALEQAAADKMKVLSFNAGVQLTKIAGNIVVLTGAGAPLGFGLSAGASAAKATAKGVQRLVQAARDKKLPFTNKEKTTEKINARASARADAVLEKIRDLPDAIYSDKDVGLYLSAKIFYTGAGGSMKDIKDKPNMSEEKIKEIRNSMGKYLATAHKL